MNLEQARFNMIEQQIRPWDVLDANILHLLAVVKREDFLPVAHKALAFVDMEIPLISPADEAIRLGQCMLAPRVEARMLQDVAVQKHEKVLEIGTGSGYMAALLAHRAQRVISLEIDEALVKVARANLQKAGIHNAEVRHADGAKGTQVEGPFDVIVLSGSVAHLPSALLAQLKVGGRLAAIVGEDPMMRALFVTRVSDASYHTTQPWDTVAPRLLNFPEPSKFSF
jgi:protein-L-isoaspartate(D-aspartate) O-methyltransferase